MVFKYAYIVPIVLCLWFLLTFVITYLISVYQKDVNPVFPYISDTGNWPPESCIFDILLTIGAVMMFIIIYVRYRQIRELCARNNFPPITEKINTISFYMGVFAIVGMIIVGCFQEMTLLIVHVIGATMCFGLGIVYQISHTVVSYIIYPTFGNRIVNAFRTITTVICIISFLITGGFGVAAFLLFKGKDFTKWTKEDGGYYFHLVSAISEWILAIAYQLYLGIFSSEFKLIHIKEPTISLVV